VLLAKVPAMHSDVQLLTKYFGAVAEELLVPILAGVVFLGLRH
jgi:hypothetical protein